MKWLRWLPLILWVVIICWLSFSSLQNVQVPKFFSADKIAHIGMYGILGLFIHLPLQNKERQWRVFIGLAIVFAAATEFIQHFFVTNRSGEFGDFIANCIGLSFAVLMKKLLLKT